MNEELLAPRPSGLGAHRRVEQNDKGREIMKRRRSINDLKYAAVARLLTNAQKIHADPTVTMPWGEFHEYLEDYCRAAWYLGYEAGRRRQRSDDMREMSS